MRTFVVTATLVLLLGACNGDDDSTGASPDELAAQEATAASTTTMKSPDGLVSVDLPQGWTQSEDELAETVAIAAQGEDPLDQVVVTTFGSLEAAQQQAESTTAGLASDDIACERVELDDKPAFDCPEDVDGETVRRVLVALGGDGAGAVLLVQTPATTFDEAAELAGPIAGSLSFG